MNSTSDRQKTVLAAFLGWMLDAFDFFLLVFLLGDIAEEFGVEVSRRHLRVIPDAGHALRRRLHLRPSRRPLRPQAGPHARHRLLFGDRGARRFAPSLWMFLLLRALFGVAMGGEWGLGSSLAMESIPPKARGFVSGILQCGYPTGFLLASIAYGLLYQRSFGDFTVGWRAMFLLSFLPALVVLFIRSHVPELPAFAEAQKVPKPNLIDTLRANWGHCALRGRADDVLQPVQPRHAGPLSDLPGKAARLRSRDRQLDHHRRQPRRDRGGLSSALVSEKIGRVNAITIAALIALPALPLWAFSSTPVCWRSAPSSCRSASRAPGASFPPISMNCRLARCARPCRASSIRPAISSPPTTARSRPSSPRRTGGDYGYALALVAGVVAVAIVIVIRFSPERRGEVMHVAY